MNYTVERTRRQIIQSFIHVLQTKRFSSITIQDICADALIHRTTFYRYYEDKYSLLRDFVYHSIDESNVNTYKTAGKTIAYSILTVFIAFLALIFAESPIYKSGVVVVIGVTILLLEILTLTPFVMKVLGKKLFWPSKNVLGLKEKSSGGNPQHLPPSTHL